MADILKLCVPVLYFVNVVRVKNLFWFHKKKKLAPGNYIAQDSQKKKQREAI